MSVILAFDFGVNSIGTAVGNTLTATVQPLKALRAKNGHIAEQELMALFAQWQPELLVVGLPLNMDGSAMNITPRARAFGRYLAAKSGLKVSFVDERLTTKEAKSMLFESGGFRRLARDKGGIDNLSAALILQTYFDAGPLTEA